MNGVEDGGAIESTGTSADPFPLPTTKVKNAEDSGQWKSQGMPKLPARAAAAAGSVPGQKRPLFFFPAHFGRSVSIKLAPNRATIIRRLTLHPALST